MATKLDLADAQFIGFHVGKREPGIIILVEGMGLTEREWKRWKKEYEVSNAYLTESEVREIDEYFEQKRKNK